MQQNDVEVLFHKMHQFTDTENWTLPKKPYSHIAWAIPLLMTNKDELNYTKSLLNNMDLQEWSQFTKSRDPSSFIISRLRQSIHPELLTQAWCKFFECLNTFPVVPEHCLLKESVNSLHLCEAPGAFICALNHFLKSKSPNFQLNWHANTLNPNYEGNPSQEMIIDDRLIKFTPNNWLFGSDITGDIRVYENFLDISERIYKEGKKSIVTADGSIDCSYDPGNQELIVAHLIYCETMCALSVLEEGGSFVLKIFTLFEDKTINILYLLTCVFKKVTLFKPCSSKSGNSEIYLVCTNFKGFTVLEEIWEDLLIPYKEGNQKTYKLTMFDLHELPQSFFLQIREFSESFMHLQMQTINDNIYHFRKKTNYKKIQALKVKVAQTYLSKFNLKKVPDYQRIVPNVDIMRSWRTIPDCFDFDDNLLIEFKIDYLIEQSVNELNIVCGKPLDNILTSKFASKETVDAYQNFPKESSINDCLNNLDANVTIYNCNEFYRPFCEFHNKFYNNILNCDNETDMIFVNHPFFTHFLVGILFLLVQSFTFVSINKQGILRLSKCNKEKLIETKKMLAEIKNKHKNIRDIHQIVSPSVFDDNPRFFRIIWNYNCSKMI